MVSRGEVGMIKIEAKNQVDITTIPKGQLVNKLGEYLYKNIDSAYTFKKSPNLYEIYLEAYYQIPIYPSHPQDKIKYDDEIKSMKILLSITQYDQKIRINLIELGEYEPTIAHKTYKIDDLKTLVYARTAIVKLINDSLTKYFKDYEFLF